MGSRNALSRRAAIAGSGAALALLMIAPAGAQPVLPCGPGETLLSLGKAAFFRSIERGAFAIGERTLDDLLDGLGGSSRSARRARSPSPAEARAAVFPPAADPTLVAALAAYVEDPSSEAADSALRIFLESATKIPFETPPEDPGQFGRVGLVLEEGGFGNRGARFAVPDMADENRRQDLEHSLFGDGADLEMGKTNKTLGGAPFFKAPVVADKRNVDRNNLGLAVRKEADLRTLWFEDYRAHLATEFSNLSPAEITEALNAGWPILQRFWAFKRTEMFVVRAQATFGTAMREIQARVAKENLKTRPCSP
jgi:hypothetical protein